MLGGRWAAFPAGIKSRTFATALASMSVSSAFAAAPEPEIVRGRQSSIGERNPVKQQTPEQQTPEQQTRTQQTPEQQTRTQQIPEQQIPEQQTRTQQTPEQQTRTQQTRTQQTPEQQTRTQQTRTQQTRTQQTPEQQTRAHEPKQAEAGAVAAQSGDGPDQTEPSALARGLAVPLAIFPGILVHGTGSYVLGRSSTGTRLLALEGIGLGLLAVGGAVIITTGAARHWVGPSAALSVAGMGLFGISFAADLYSVLAPRGGFGQHDGRQARFESEVGYRYVYDPQFPHRHFTVAGFDARWASWRLSPSLWSAPGGSNQRWVVPVAFRLLGATPEERSGDGSYLDLETGWTRQDFFGERFVISSVEASARGRLDLAAYDAGLEGSFAELGVGMATQIIAWDVQGVEAESATMLLSRFGFGVYVDHASAGSGEWQLYYDHRHDGLASGLLIPGLGSGVAGHFGLEGEHFVTDQWGLGLEFQVGSAIVGGLSARYRYRGGA